MKNTIYVLRVLAFIVASVLIFIPINWGLFSLGKLFLWSTIKLGRFWTIVLLFIGVGSFLWRLFKLLSSVFIGLISLLSPSKALSLVVLTILAVINGYDLIARIWSLFEVDGFWGIIGLLYLSSLILGLTWTIISGVRAVSSS